MLHWYVGKHPLKSCHSLVTSLIHFQPKDQKFEFPNMFDKASDAKEEHEKSLRETKDNYKRFLDRTKARPGAPGWFSF